MITTKHDVLQSSHLANIPRLLLVDVITLCGYLLVDLGKVILNTQEWRATLPDLF